MANFQILQSNNAQKSKKKDKDKSTRGSDRGRGGRGGRGRGGRGRENNKNFTEAEKQECEFFEQVQPSKSDKTETFGQKINLNEKPKTDESLWKVKASQLEKINEYLQKSHN